MRLLFMGTPAFSVPSLERLAQGAHEIVEVITRPDSPRGRGRKPAAPPVKEAAERLCLPMRQTASVTDEALREHIASLRPDLIVVVAFRILPPEILSIPPLGAVNLHASLLPKYRGAAPINWALIHGEAVTGITVFQLESTVDTGAIVRQRPTAIGPDETYGELYDRLSVIGAEELAIAVDELAACTATPTVQEDSAATAAPKLRKEDARIDWRLPSERIRNLVRGTTPSPGAHTTWCGKPFGVARVEAAIDVHPPGSARPGEIVVSDARQGVSVATGDGAVWMRVVQPAGKRQMDGGAWARGARPAVGEVFG